MLDTGSVPSPFFTNECDDQRVRYFHLPFHLGLSVDAALKALQIFARVAHSPPEAVQRWGGLDAWVKAWKPTVDGLKELAEAYTDMKRKGEPTHEQPEQARSAACTRAVFQAVKSFGPTTSFSLGAKRNWLAAHAKGAYHVNFDDDDVYLPSYVARMVHALRTCDAELVKIAHFIEFNAHDDELRRLGSSAADEPELLPVLQGVHKFIAESPDFQPSHPNRWGYGFSYVHTCRLAFRCPYPPKDFGEDYQKVLEAAKHDPERRELGLGPTGGPPPRAMGVVSNALKPCVCFADSLGDAVVIHIKHGTNTSSVENVVPLLREPASDAAFDAFFAEPCRHLVRPSIQHARASMPDRMRFVAGLGGGEALGGQRALGGMVDASTRPRGRGVDVDAYDFPRTGTPSAANITSPSSLGFRRPLVAETVESGGRIRNMTKDQWGTADRAEPSHVQSLQTLSHMHYDPVVS